MGETQFKDVERLELGSTMSVYDKATINGDNSIKEVVFIETTGANGPRIQQMQDSTIHIGTLTVNKSETMDGTLTTSNLVDKSKPAEDGRVAFVVDNGQHCRWGRSDRLRRRQQGWGEDNECRAWQC